MAETIVCPSGIYKIENTVNGKCYVGSAVNLVRRKKNHFSGLRTGKHKNAHLQNACNKYGIGSFKFTCIEQVIDKKLLISCEQKWIDLLQPDYNIARFAGSTLGFRHSEESKKMMAELATGKRYKWSSGAIERNKNRKLTAEHSLRISQALKGKVKTPEQIRKIADAHIGNVHSEDARKRMSQSQKARWTDDMRAEASVRRKGRVHSPETIQRMSEARALFWQRKREA